MSTRVQLRLRPPQGWRQLPHDEGELVQWAQELLEEQGVVPSLRQRYFGSVLAHYRWAERVSADAAWVMVDTGETGFIRAAARITIVRSNGRSAEQIDTALDAHHPDTLLARRRTVTGGEIVERARAVFPTADDGVGILQYRYWGMWVPADLPWCVQIEIGTNDVSLFEDIPSIGGAILESIGLAAEGEDAG